MPRHEPGDPDDPVEVFAVLSPTGGGSLSLFVVEAEFADAVKRARAVRGVVVVWTVLADERPE